MHIQSLKAPNIYIIWSILQLINKNSSESTIMIGSYAEPLRIREAIKGCPFIEVIEKFRFKILQY